MHVIETMAFATLGVVVCDWILMGRLASFCADFDYRYWPLTWARVTTLAVAAATASASALFLTPGAIPPWPLFVWAIVFALWTVVAVDDVARQRRLGYRAPPRYSEPDD